MDGNGCSIGTHILSYKPGLSAGTLCTWRYQGKGPSYYKVGNAVRYKIADVEAWKNENVKRVELTN